MTRISDEDLQKLLDEATPGRLSAHKSAVFDQFGHCIALCTTGINKAEDDQANAQGMAAWRDLATEVLALRKRVAAADAAREAIKPFDSVGCEMFAKNWNAGDLVFDGGPMRSDCLFFEDFLNLRAALAAYEASK